MSAIGQPIVENPSSFEAIQELARKRYHSSANRMLIRSLEMAEKSLAKVNIMSDFFCVSHFVSACVGLPTTNIFFFSEAYSWIHSFCEKSSWDAYQGRRVRLCSSLCSVVSCIYCSQHDFDCSDGHLLLLSLRFMKVDGHIKCVSSHPAPF